MIRPITIDPDQEQEGLCYDLERARAQGLFEKMTIRAQHPDGQTIDLQMTDALFTELLRATDGDSNIGPDDKTFMLIGVSYKYDYGDPILWAEEDLETIANIRDEQSAPAHP